MKIGMKTCIKVALDGNDGTGKSTLARAIANELGGTYVRPFSGRAGKEMLQIAEDGNFSVASSLARKLVDNAVAKNDGCLLVFDRLWMTAFTILPESYWSDWEPLEPTILCWADIETTMNRLHDRKE